MAMCEGLAKGFAKDLAKDLTCTSKESKGFFRDNTYKHYLSSLSPYGYRTLAKSFNPFASQVKPFANPFAKSFATPSHPVRGHR